MTERERLIELLDDEKGFSRWMTDDERREKLADHLLANGVTVPPCNIGDEIYFPGIDTIYETVCCGFSRDEFDNLIIIDKIGEYHRAKRFFLTREEAEAALKERDENERADCIL